MQIVGYRTGEAVNLLVGDGGDVESVGLSPGSDLAYTLGDRHCAGRVDETGHEACDADAAPRCRDHRSTWACALCSGNCSMPLDSCHEEHAVYLAAFAPDTFKVGVTRLWRLETRLREQGADRGAHVHTVPDGRVARRIEADLAERIPDRVRVPRKVAGLHRDVDEAAWADLLSGFDVRDTYSFDYGLDLTERPVSETVATGTVRGTKGRIVVLDNGGSAYAVDLRSLVGYEVEQRATDRALQSSLGAFE